MLGLLEVAAFFSANNRSPWNCCRGIKVQHVCVKMASMRRGFLTQISRGLARCEERSRPEKCINSVQLLGRVGQFPKKGKGNVWRFPLATNTSYYSKDEFGESKLVHKTQWHNISIFKPYLQQKAEEIVTKGSRVLVHGRLDYVSYDDDSGNRRSYASIVIDDLIMLTSPEGRNVERNFDEDDPDFEEMN